MISSDLAYSSSQPINPPPIKSIEICKKFFDDYAHITNSTRNEFEKFFDNYAPHAVRVNELRKKKAPRFNIFSSLDICRDECITSKFIATLLDPHGMHDQGSLFLRSFFKFILNDDISEQIANRAKVLTEAHIDESGRLDILIEVPAPEYRFIVIENKINAQESPNQIGKYQGWLKRQVSGQHKIVFLTPDGRESESLCKNENEIPVIPLSYYKLVDWLRCDFDTLPKRIAFVVRQFCEIYNKDLIEGVNMDAELELFMRHKLSDAWDISEAFSEVRDTIYNAFWNHVAKFITEQLGESSVDWSASANSGKPHGLYIRYKNDGRLIKIGARMYTETNKDCAYGIWISRKNMNCRTIQGLAEVKIISESLQKENFKYSSGKIASKKLKDIVGIELSYEKDALLTMNADNDGDHIIAKKIANAIFELFMKYQTEITKINELYYSGTENYQTDTEQDED